MLSPSFVFNLQLSLSEALPVFVSVRTKICILTSVLASFLLFFYIGALSAARESERGAEGCAGRGVGQNGEIPQVLQGSRLVKTCCLFGVVYCCVFIFIRFKDILRCAFFKKARNF